MRAMLGIIVWKIYSRVFFTIRSAGAFRSLQILNGAKTHHNAIHYLGFKMMENLSASKTQKSDFLGRINTFSTPKHRKIHRGEDSFL